MAILVACSRCGSKLRAPDGAVGKTLACPRCGNKVAVAAGGSSGPVAQGLPQPAAAAKSRLPLVVTEYIARHLMPGEQLVAVARIHPMVTIAPGICVIIGLLFSLGSFAPQKGGIFLFTGLSIAVIFGAFFVFRLIERRTTEYSCTDRRILIKSGLLSTQLREMPLSQVEALNLQQGLLGKLLGYGTVVFKGSGGTSRTCQDIEAPLDFYKRVQEQVDAAQQRR